MISKGVSHFLSVAGSGMSTYELFPKYPLRLLDLETEIIEILANMLRPHVRCLVQEDTLDIDARGLILRPAGIDCHVLVDLLQGSFAVLQSHVPNGSDVLLLVELRQLLRVSSIWRRRLSWATIRIDDHDKMQVRVVFDATVCGQLLLEKAIVIWANPTLCAEDPKCLQSADSCIAALSLLISVACYRAVALLAAKEVVL